jgi:hypothetical protein
MVSSWVLSPFFDVGFSQTATVRPFLRGQFGFGGITTTTSDPTGTSSEREDELSILRLAAGFGVYVFPIEQLSVDARLDLVYVSVTETLPGAAEDVEASGVGGVLVVGLTGWFGRENPKSAAPLAATTDDDGVYLSNAPPSEPPPEADLEPQLSGGGRASLEGDRGIRVTMAGNVILRLDYPTEAGAERVAAVFLVPESVAAGADCSSPQYFYGDDEPQSLGIPVSQVMRGSEQVTVFDGELSTETLARLAKRRKAKSGFVLCEQTLEVVENQREAVRDFLRKSR